MEEDKLTSNTTETESVQRFFRSLNRLAFHLVVEVFKSNIIAKITLLHFWFSVVSTLILGTVAPWVAFYK